MKQKNTPKYKTMEVEQQQDFGTSSKLLLVEVE